MKIDVEYHELITNKDIDRRFPAAVAATAEGRGLYQCVACGKCSAGCPISDALEVLPHQIIRKAILGLKTQVLSCPTIWVCATCFRCNDRCPEQVNPASIMFVLKNMATDEGIVPEGIQTLVRSLYANGWASTIINYEREELNLPEVPEANDTIRTILDRAGLKKKSLLEEDKG
ncbi:MAG: 4Fe-4S dicluster domain-containing protein [Candidatus Lokiarchaeota archaeon]|nr:4Fe-4S dicluster domain-containing protein [Candidatus Lokiarchaeota archaeon]